MTTDEIVRDALAIAFLALFAWALIAHVAQRVRNFKGSKPGDWVAKSQMLHLIDTTPRREKWHR
jgi:hypothetical protein